jgi:DNA-nicking Smr family endonuclease
MSADRRRDRGLSADERSLWDGVTRAITPLAPRRKRALPRVEAVSTAPEPAKPIKSRAKPASTPPAVRPSIPTGPPPLAPLGRRLKQSVARGRAAIDARIDLHGLTQSEAHHVLARFLRRAQADGAKIVLVVTGKGAAGAGNAAGERGVLRRQVPLWLSLPELRSLVVGFEPAGVGHGGEGALYVRIRRVRPPS